jgi:hypothetical protein
MAPIRIFPPSTVANDVASVTIAGHTFAAAGGAAGGILNLRISLRGSTLAELARVLARLEGVRVTSGPAIASRGDCYLVHAPGFKMVLSAPAPGGDYAPALLSRTIDSNPPKVAVTCDLAAVFAGLMTAPPPPRIDEAPVGAARAAAAVTGETGATGDRSPNNSTLRRAALQPGKTLARKTPLTRKTPLRRGTWSKPRS